VVQRRCWLFVPGFVGPQRVIHQLHIHLDDIDPIDERVDTIGTGSRHSSG
jgi:hypothetical protein